MNLVYSSNPGARTGQLTYNKSLYHKHRPTRLAQHYWQQLNGTSSSYCCIKMQTHSMYKRYAKVGKKYVKFKKNIFRL